MEGVNDQGRYNEGSRANEGDDQVFLYGYTWPLILASLWLPEKWVGLPITTKPEAKPEEKKEEEIYDVAKMY